MTLTDVETAPLARVCRVRLRLSRRVVLREQRVRLYHRMETRHVCIVEKRRKPITSSSQKHELSPVELNARRTALELARDHEFVVKALEARGERVDRSASPADLRKGYTHTEWHALIREGQTLS